jgi:all-trans-retinol 13,14-reductase
MSPGSHDVIVIGSGIGGLTAALRCAQAGRSVLVLEAAKQFGGFINPFQRKHFWFDTGIHYIGEMGPGQSLRRHFERLELYDAIGFRELNPDGFDRYIFPDYEVRLGKGAQTFRDQLVQDFPQETRGIDKFFALLAEMSQTIRKVTKLRGLGSALKLAKHAPMLIRYRNATFNDILDDCVGDYKLRAALSGPGGDIGLPPGEASGFMMLGLLDHFLGGAYFPRGGTKAVRDAYVHALRERGATLLRNTAVDSILTSGGKVTGVRSLKGETYLAPVVISNADAALTLGSMLGRDKLGRRLRNKVNNTQQSLGSLCAFVGTDLQPQDYGVDDANIWSYPSYDIDALYRPALDGRLGSELPFFLTVPTLKDPGGTHAPAGKHTVELITFAAFKPFRRWQNQKVLKRDSEYMALKNEMGMALVKRAEKFLPGLSERMEVHEFSTPLTNTSFANVPEGAIYGPSHTPAQFGLGRYRPKGPVDGLFLCGSSVMGAGIGTCVASGMLASKLALQETRPARQRQRAVVSSAHPA